MSLPALKLRVEAKELSPFASLLQDSGYNEESICRLLGISDLSLLNGSKLAEYVRTCGEESSKLASLVKLFLLGEGVSRRDASQLLGRELLSTLTLCGLLFRSSGSIFCHAVVYPRGEQFIVTDYWVSKFHNEGKVYELGTDSYVLSRVTPRKGYKYALDLCTGSGVHAIQSAAECLHSCAVDINPRALDYTLFNAALNSVTCHPHLGDLFQPLPEGSFDLITANPPFVPSPDPEILVHRSAGETGEEVPERLVAGLPKRLAEGGLYSMVLEYPVTMTETYLDRLERWLNQTHGWGIAVLSFGERSVNSYIELHVTETENREEMIKKYRESYQKQGIVSIEFANVFILRLPHASTNWKIKAASVWPKESRAESISEWLKACSTFLAPLWKPQDSWTPKLHKRFQQFSLDSGLLPLDKGWLVFEELSPTECRVLAALNGERSVANLGQALSIPGAELEAILRRLASRLIIE